MEAGEDTRAYEQYAERARELNEQILTAGKKLGRGYLEAYENALKSIADFQERLSKQSDADWLSTVIDAQAKFTRELAQAYLSAGREVTK